MTIKSAVSIFKKAFRATYHQHQRDQGVFGGKLDFVMHWVLSAAMAFWEGRGELLYSCYHAWLLQCCTIRTLHENQEGGFCQNEQAPGKRHREREKLPPVLYIHTLQYADQEYRTHSRPSTETQTLVLLRAAHPIRDVNMLDTANAVLPSQVLSSPLVCIQVPFSLVDTSPGASKTADGCRM